MGHPRQATFRMFGLTLVSFAWAAAAPGQGSSTPDKLSAVTSNGHAVASATAAQTADIFGLANLVDKLQTLRAERGADTAPTMEERMIRLDLLQAIEAASLEVDEVVAEIQTSAISLVICGRHCRCVATRQSAHTPLQPCLLDPLWEPR